MDKSLSALLFVVTTLFLVTGNEGASISRSTDNTDTRALWYSLANLSQEHRARRQISNVAALKIDDGSVPRYRREVTPAVNIEHKMENQTDDKNNVESSEDKETVIPTVSATATGVTTTIQKPNQVSVLLLIRDALKKVTTNLPTEQVASNALQYFQLFEHFLQQTIEQVIDDVDAGDDDEDEETTTTKTDELDVVDTTDVPYQKNDMKSQQQEQGELVGH